MDEVSYALIKLTIKVIKLAMSNQLGLVMAIIRTKPNMGSQILAPPI